MKILMLTETPTTLTIAIALKMMKVIILTPIQVSMTVTITLTPLSTKIKYRTTIPGSILRKAQAQARFLILNRAFSTKEAKMGYSRLSAS
jgi:hypothetical protein